MLQDALDEIARQRPKDLFKPLRVHFISEDGIDAGGVKKEFFQLLVAELLCPDYGMLIQLPVRFPSAPSSSTLKGNILNLDIRNAILPPELFDGAVKLENVSSMTP